MDYSSIIKSKDYDFLKTNEHLGRHVIPITLLLNCNPNTMELLGLNREHYLYLNDFGKELIANTELFLSKRGKS